MSHFLKSYQFFREPHTCILCTSVGLLKLAMLSSLRPNMVQLWRILTSQLHDKNLMPHIKLTII